MGLRLRRRRDTTPVPPPAPPADGAAPCLDPYSRGWAHAPVAGRFVDWEAAAHHAGFGQGFCGVWHADDPLTPLERFAIDPAGVGAANLLLRRLELLPALAARRLTGARLTADTGDALLLLAQEREAPGWHVHHGVEGAGWFVHEFGALEIPRTGPGSATLHDALDRAEHDWGPLEWQPVPPAVPRGLLDTFAWARGEDQAAAS
jgi:hypothetical protein